jgi:formylglycine-generating enzyme required for sulfatase activity
VGGTPSVGGSSDGGGDAGLLPISCAPGGDGLTNCGSASESCCTSLLVTGGTYHREYTSLPDGGPTAQANLATVASFRLDKYEVTVGRFRQFVAAWNASPGWRPGSASGKHTHLDGGGLTTSDGGIELGWATTDSSYIAPKDANLTSTCGIPAGARAAWATWTSSAGLHEKLPINCVNWYEAAAFCIWDGGFLPSEAEWEYAAAGGNTQRVYPWGPTDPGTTNEYAIYGSNYNGGSAAPVGTPAQGAGLYGQVDLAGNLYEWNMDKDTAYTTPCTNCTDTTPATPIRSFRGGCFSSIDATPLQSWWRDGNLPGNRDSAYGIRCARTP